MSFAVFVMVVTMTQTQTSPDTDHTGLTRLIDLLLSTHFLHNSCFQSSAHTQHSDDFIIGLEIDVILKFLGVIKIV